MSNKVGGGAAQGEDYEEGGSTPLSAKRFTPYGEEGRDSLMPIQLLSAEEKIDELNNVVEHKDMEIENLKSELEREKESSSVDRLRDKIDEIVL